MPTRSRFAPRTDGVPLFVDRRRCKIGVFVGVLGAAVLALTPTRDVVSAQVCGPSFSSSSLRIAPRPNSTEQPELRVLTKGSFFPTTGDRSGCRCDLAVAARTRLAGDFVTLFRSEGDGTFTQMPGPALDIPSNPQAIAGGRFSNSGTGLDDFVVLTEDASARLTIFVPKENGRYESGGSFEVGRGPIAVTTGHFDGDRELDVAVLTAERLDILLGDGRGGFRVESVPIAGGRSIAAGRFSPGRTTDEVAVATIVQTKVSLTVVRQNAAKRFEAKLFGTLGQAPEVKIVAANVSAGDRSDLIAAFTNPGDQIGGGVMVLRGTAGDGFQNVQILPFNLRPQFLAVDDVNDDNVPDLIVGTIVGAGTPEPKHLIQMFPGIATEGRFASQPFRELPPLETRALTTGRFGPRRAVGLAVGGRTAISVFRPDGAGTPLVTTPVPADARLFVTGDFHSIGGDDQLDDLAYVSFDKNLGEHVLSVLLNTGDRDFRRAPSPLVLQLNPRLIAAGRFDGKKSEGQKTVDTVDLAVVSSGPTLKILLGEGDGRFKPRPGISEFPLDAGDFPVAIATGHFRGQDESKPLDIAIVSATAGGGKLTILFNDGQAGFDEKPLTESLPFTPKGMVVSNRFRPERTYDFAIKTGDENGFVFLANRGDGRIIRRTFHGTGQRITIGDPASIVVRHVNKDDLDDIVTFERNMATNVFINNGFGSFGIKNVDTLPTLGANVSVSTKYLLEDFGDGRLSAVALVPVKRGKIADAFRPDADADGKGDGSVAIVIRKADASGSFTDPQSVATPGPKRALTPDVVKLPLKPEDIALADRQTEVRRDGSSPDQSHTVNDPIDTAFVGRFGRGQRQPALGFLARARAITVTPEACPNDSPPDPGFVIVCHVEQPEQPDPDARCPDPRHPKELIPCPPLKPKQICERVPGKVFCSTTTEYAYVSVLPSTCHD